MFSHHVAFALRLVPRLVELLKRLDRLCAAIPEIAAWDEQYVKRDGLNRFHSPGTTPWLLEIHKTVATLVGKFAATLVAAKCDGGLVRDMANRLHVEEALTWIGSDIFKGGVEPVSAESDFIARHCVDVEVDVLWSISRVCSCDAGFATKEAKRSSAFGASQSQLIVVCVDTVFAEERREFVADISQNAATASSLMKRLAGSLLCSRRFVQNDARPFEQIGRQ